MKYFLLLFLFSTLFFITASAQWVQTNGPYGAVINCMVARDSNLIVGVEFTSICGGIFYSSNNGKSWKSVKDNLYNAIILCMAIDGNNVYASTEKGIYFSVDGGESWNKMLNAFPNQIIPAIAVSGGNIIIGKYDGIFISNDNGNSWNPSNSGLTYLHINGLKTDGANIFATSDADGVHRSNDNGLTWTSLNNGLTDLDIQCFYTNDSVLFAGTQTGGVFYSNDLGNNWTSIGLQGNSIYSVGISDSTIFAATVGGVFITNDYGNTWVNSNIGLTDLNINEIFVSDTLIFACTQSGLHVSSDLGNSWQLTGVPAIDISALTYFGDNIFAGSSRAPGYNSGVFLSSNNGDSWKTANTGLPLNSLVIITELQSIGNKVIASLFNQGLYISTDTGATWTSANTGIIDSNIFVITVNNGNLYAGGTMGKIYFSSDSAQSWTPLNPISPISSNSHISGIEFIGQSIFVANYGYYCNNIYRSDDNGLTWDPLNIIPTNASVQIFDSKGTSLFAETDQIYRSDDLGVTWTPTWSGSSNLWVTSLESDVNNVYAGTALAGSFYFSADNGFNWTCDNTGLPDSSGLAYHAILATPNFIFAGIGTAISKLSVIRRPISDLTSNHELETAKFDFEVYPNPASDHITVRFSKEIALGKIEIINALGQTLFLDVIKNSSFKEIQLQSKFTGICVLKVTSDNSSQAKIIVKESY